MTTKFITIEDYENSNKKIIPKNTVFVSDYTTTGFHLVKGVGEIKRSICKPFNTNKNPNN